MHTKTLSGAACELLLLCEHLKRSSRHLLTACGLILGIPPLDSDIGTIMQH